MKTYKVTYTEKLIHTFYVEAENEEEAEDKATEAFEDGESEIGDSYLENFIIEEEA